MSVCFFVWHVLRVHLPLLAWIFLISSRFVRHCTVRPRDRHNPQYPMGILFKCAPAVAIGFVLQHNRRTSRPHNQFCRLLPAKRVRFFYQGSANVAQRGEDLRQSARKLIETHELHTSVACEE